MPPEARELYERCLRGDLEPALAWLGTPAARDRASRGWSLALRAACVDLAPDSAAAVEPEELDELTSAAPPLRHAAALAAALKARGSALEFDRLALAADVARLAALARDAAEEPALWLETHRHWLALFEGRRSPPAALEELHRRAAAVGSAPLVIEAAVLRALHHAAAGEWPEALRAARRSSRMARTEALPHQELLAHLVLARIRRSTGHPHLATRILVALLRVAPPAFQAFLRWELLLAGRIEPIAGRGRAADALQALLAALATGDLALADRQRASTLAAVSGWVELGPEVVAITAGLDPRVEVATLAPELVPWFRGETVAAPAAMHGLLRSGADPGASVVFALGAPGRTGRRVLRLGEPSTAEGPLALRLGRRKTARLETLAAVLVLAGTEGRDEHAVFELVYGFPYEADQHRGVFDVLVHRTREYLAPVGELERSGGRLRLALSAPVLVPDPRCAPSLADRLLRHLAEHGGLGARELATGVGLALRTTQTALQELVEDGACEVRKDGREVIYVVEDTTFSEPTRPGRFAPEP